MSNVFTIHTPASFKRSKIWIMSCKPIPAQVYSADENLFRVDAYPVCDGEQSAIR